VSQLAALRDLRAAIDRAVTSLEPVLPALEAWQASRAAPAPQEHAPEPAAAPVAAAVSSSDRAPGPVVPSLFDPLPKPVPSARRQAGNGATTSSCERCRTQLVQPPRGARRRYCSTTCRTKAKADRLAEREAGGPGLEPLPDRVERPFTVFEHPDDFRSDAELLRPPRLDWELKEHATP
jgi:hypothetical protein